MAKERLLFLLKQQAKVYTEDNENYFIKDEDCMGCGEPFPKMLALQCGNGYWSWKCAKCWSETNIGNGN